MPFPPKSGVDSAHVRCRCWGGWRLIETHADQVGCAHTHRYHTKIPAITLIPGRGDACFSSFPKTNL